MMNLPPPSELSRPEALAWAAGFIDGEGHFGVKRHHHRKVRGSIRFIVSQVQREPLERLMGYLGVGKIYGPYRNRAMNEKTSSYFQYQCEGLEAVLPIVVSVWPYLSGPKREQIVRVLEEVKPPSDWWMTTPSFSLIKVPFLPVEDS